MNHSKIIKIIKGEESCYDNNQFSVIVLSFRQKADFDSVRFHQSLERCAWLYVAGVEISDQIVRPAQRGRELQRLHNQMTALSKAINDARDDPHLNKMLADAADADEQNGPVHKALSPLADAMRTVQEAIKRAQGQQSRGGNRADGPLYELMLSLGDLYQAVAEVMHPPTGWSVDEGTDEFIRFVQASLSPLGVKKTDGALLKIYQRATAGT